MSFRVNTNVSAMNSLRNLKQTGMDVAKSTNRLSTGLRINSAADDPSGLIASESYRAQLSSMDAALKNNQDAINYAKTAEGGLDETSRLLREARTLAVANGSSALDAAQKQANQTQLNNIVASIDRVATNTQYGSIKLLNGSAGTTAAVADKGKIESANFTGTFSSAAMTASGGVNVQVTTAAAQASHNGSKTTYTAATNTTGAGSFTVNGKTFTNDAATTVAGTVQKINEASGETGVIAVHDTTNNRINLKSVGYGSDSKINLTDSGSIIQSAAGSASASGTNAVASVTYNSQTVTFNQGKGLELKDTAGNSVKLTEGGNATATYTSAIQVTAGSTQFQIGANAGQTTTLSIGNFSSSTLGFGSLDITGTDMSTAMNAIDAAINSVSESRGRIGSFIRNTIESNVRSLNVSKENLAATESSVREIDVAEEMTNFTKQQILQQSGVSMLAQANQGPQAVLSLIR
jgi:flagellin